MIEFNIRAVKENELDELVELCALHAEFEKASYDKTNKKELLAEQLFFVDPKLYCVVVDSGLYPELLGYATYMAQFSTWDATLYLYLDCLYLRPSYRGNGIGERMMDFIKEEAKRLNCTHVQWQTPDFNQRAIKFYDRIGGSSKTKERYSLNL